MTTNKSCYCINLVVAGRKTAALECGIVELGPGDLYFMSAATASEGDNASADFQELRFAFGPDELQTALATLPAFVGDTMPQFQTAPVRCHYAVDEGTRAFFEGLHAYRSWLFSAVPDLKRIKLSELLNFIARSSQPGASSVLSRIVGLADNDECRFRSLVMNHIFEKTSLAELAERAGMSLTAFKNEFKRLFNDTPHRWVVRQRLLHARLLVSGTGKGIAQIGYECRFNTTSHFIKMFRREFGDTPLHLRRRHAAKIAAR